ncbi:MAG: hypothetical protein H0W84_11475 [Bacteroidetes bacterium]|nr:hypothetical protein [Bacteroidota bacterium]
MRTPSNDLYELIKSLSGNEKSYIKKKSGNFSSNDKIYLKLFDAINKYGTNEKKIQSTLKIKGISKAKNYLYEIILKSLRSYYKDISVNTNLTDMLRDIEILYKKALFVQCSKLLDRAKKIAEKENKSIMLLQIFEMEYKLFINFHFKNSAEVSREREIRQLRILEEYSNTVKYSALSSKMLSFIKVHGHMRGVSAYTELTHIADDPLLKDVSNAVTEQSKSFFYNLNIVSTILLSDYEKACYYCRQKVKLIEAELSDDNSERKYALELSNLAIAETMSQQYSEAASTINKMKSILINAPSKEMKVLLFQIVSISELNLLIHAGKPDKLHALLPGIEDGLKNYKNSLNIYYKMNIHDNISKLFFMLRAFKKSLEWINPLIIEDPIQVRPDYQCLIRIFYLVIHYEMKNFELLSYLTINTYRFLKKMGGLYDFEETIITFMKRVSTMSGDSHIQEFKRLRKELISFNNNKFDKKVFEDFDYLSWVESKIENIPYPEIIRRKVAARS